jgi:prepilin-type N-terminal cleavage/methylation domain-containing protein
MTFSKHQKFIAGFSLIEIIVVIFVLGLISVVVVTFQNDVFSLNTRLSNNLTSQSEAKGTLTMMTSEIRAASPSSNGAYPLAEANATSFIFYSNIDKDQLKERVRYFLSDNTLKKGVIKPSENPLVYNPANEVVSEVVHGIVNGATPIFSYYDKNYDNTFFAMRIYHGSLSTKPSDNGKGNTPGFELIFLLCAIGVSILLWKKKRNI